MTDKQSSLALQDAPTEVSPLTMVQMAVAQGSSIEVVERLMGLAERWQANQAKQYYDAAIAKFKANPPRIVKNKEVSFGNTSYSHATLDEVTAKVTAALSAVGISHKWEVAQDGPKISVSCVLTHAHGHSEKTTLSAAADTSGSKNPIQAIGSAVTYLQRYTLLAATGLAVAGSDDDGAGTEEPSGMLEADLLEWLDGIRQAPNLAALKDTYAKAYKAAQSANDKKAMDEIISAKDAARKSLA